jgi:hypothetical protein
MTLTCSCLDLVRWESPQISVWSRMARRRRLLAITGLDCLLDTSATHDSLPAAPLVHFECGRSLRRRPTIAATTPGWHTAERTRTRRRNLPGRAGT